MNGAEVHDCGPTVPEKIEYSGGTGESMVSARVDKSGPYVVLVDSPALGEGGDGRVVPGDIVTNDEWVCLHVRLADVVGLHQGLTYALWCSRRNPHVSTHELMERLTSCFNRGSDFCSQLH